MYARKAIAKRRELIKAQVKTLLKETPFIIHPCMYQEVLMQAWSLANAHVRGLLASDIESQKELYLYNKNGHYVYHIYCHPTDYHKLAEYILVSYRTAVSC